MLKMVAISIVIHEMSLVSMRSCNGGEAIWAMLQESNQTLLCAWLEANGRMNALELLSRLSKGRWSRLVMQSDSADCIAFRCYFYLN